MRAGRWGAMIQHRSLPTLQRAGAPCSHTGEVPTLASTPGVAFELRMHLALQMPSPVIA